MFVNLRVVDGSLSARRAWIEMLAFRLADMSNAVALRKESVDRNLYYGDDLTFADVALRKESVDRNYCWRSCHSRYCRSLSARRAWIEMQVFQRIAKPFRVALRKESVDRNPCVS